MSWRERLRALFCCFAPDASEQYYRSGEGEAAVIRPPQPPTPPAYRGEPVIGSLQVRARRCCVNTAQHACCRAAAPRSKRPQSLRRVPPTGRGTAITPCTVQPCS